MKWIFNAPYPLFRQLIFLQGFVFLLSSTEMYLNCKMKKCLGNRGLIQEVLHFVIKLVVYTERKPISVRFLILNSSEHNPKIGLTLRTYVHGAIVPTWMTGSSDINRKTTTKSFSWDISSFS